MITIPDFSNFGASLTDDTPNEFVWNGHFMCLLTVPLLVAARVIRAQLTSGQCRQS